MFATSTHSSTSLSVLPSKLDSAALVWPGFMLITDVLALRGAELDVSFWCASV